MGRSALITLIVGLLVGLVSGLFLWLVVGLHFGLLEVLRQVLSFGSFAAFYAGMCYGLGERSRTIQPAARLRWLWSTVRLRTTLAVSMSASEDQRGTPCSSGCSLGCSLACSMR
jgi:uncharacterized membrane protein